jgi:hypothetical protein
VASIAEEMDAALVTLDGDFKEIAARAGIGQRRYRRLSLIRFERCRESRAADRMASLLSLIDHEWRLASGQNDRRLFMVITSDVIRLHR